jgi:hypothetical protein
VLDTSCLARSQRASSELVPRAFDEFAATAGFMEVGEEVLGSLLDDDGLMTESKERVFEATVRWMRGGDGGRLLGEGLLRKVLFPVHARRLSGGTLTRPTRRGLGWKGWHLRL